MLTTACGSDGTGDEIETDNQSSTQEPSLDLDYDFTVVERPDGFEMVCVYGAIDDCDWERSIGGKRLDDFRD